MLYNTKGEVPDEEYVVPIGKAEVKREGDHCTIVTYGKSVLLAQQAADALRKEGISVEIVDLRTIRPMDVEAIAASVRKTNRAVVLEEGWEMAGVGAKVSDFIQRECFDDLDAPVVRVHQADVPMPYAKNLEKAAKARRGEDDRGSEESVYLEIAARSPRYGYQGLHGGALAHDGRGAPRQMVEERRRCCQER